MLIDEILTLGISMKDDKFDKQKCLQMFDRAIATETTNFHNFLFKKINPRM